MKFDDIVDVLGDFGPYQRRVYFLSCVPNAIASIQAVVTVFTLAVPDHRCSIPGLDNDTYSVQGPAHQKLINWTLPWTDAVPGDSNIWGSAQCKVYADRGANNYGLSADAIVSDKTVACSKWVFDTSVFRNSFVTETGLVCDDLPLKSHANSIYMAGLLVGSFVTGICSDRYGRRTTILMSLAVFSPCAVATAFATGRWWLFATLRFFTGTGVMGLVISSFILAMEMVGRSWRTFAGCFVHVYWSLGMVVLVALAFFFRTSMSLQLAASVWTIAFVSLWWLIPESPRWLMSQKRMKEAKKVLEKVAKSNGTTIPAEAFQDMELVHKENGAKSREGDHSVEVEIVEEGLLSICKYPVLVFRMVVLFINWLVISMAYYGLTLGVGTLGGSIYFNFFLTALMDCVGNSVPIFALPKFGRKRFHCFVMILGGIANICIIIPRLMGSGNINWLSIVLSNIGKFGLTSGFLVMYVFTAELFPTHLRNSVVGTSSVFARIGGIISPYIADLGVLVGGEFGTALPYVIFGLCGLVAGLLALTLPETLNQKLPETMQDALNFGKDKKVKVESGLSAESAPTETESFMKQDV